MVVDKFKHTENEYGVECPQISYNSTRFAKLMKEEELKSRPKETTPIDLIISRQFLIDQGKTKKAEAAWFDRLEDELDRIETDERMLKAKMEFKAKMIKDKNQQKSQSAEKSKE